MRTPNVRDRRARVPAIVAEPDGHDDALLVRAPAIGWWESAPADGLLVGPGSSLGTLTTGTRRQTIVLPPGRAGRVRLVKPAGRRGVAFGETLVRLEPLGGGLDDDSLLAGAASSGAGRVALAVVSPTDGVFYRRPTADAAPFVEPGARVRRGQPVGLVEVMKTFNQVLYGATDLPDEAEVVEFAAADGEEVAAGQPLVVVRAR